MLATRISYRARAGTSNGWMDARCKRDVTGARCEFKSRAAPPSSFRSLCFTALPSLYYDGLMGSSAYLLPSQNWCSAQQPILSSTNVAQTLLPRSATYLNLNPRPLTSAHQPPASQQHLIRLWWDRTNRTSVRTTVPCRCEGGRGGGGTE